MRDWQISLGAASVSSFSKQNHVFASIPDFMDRPETAVEQAVLQKFAKITPQYPGLRAPLEDNVRNAWLALLSPFLDKVFGATSKGRQILVWYSVVTAKPNELIPMQRLPHVDGTDPDLIAMMLYLNHTPHGGTAFFRHRSTGFEELTDQTFPKYKASLEADVRATGMPAARYVTDGAPHFERIHASTGSFNEAIFYRGNVLHSGIIDNDAPLPADPRTGRLTINALFRPK